MSAAGARPAAHAATSGAAPPVPPGTEHATMLAVAGRLGLDLPPGAAGRLVAYLDLLERWNRVYNLTSVRGRDGMRVQHLHDSLAIVAALRRRIGPGAPRILDVGTGAGLPGLVIAVCMPDAHVTCVDAVGKKAAFVAQAAGQLDLPRVSAVHGRVEDLRAAGTFDVVTARAFATLADTIRHTRQVVADAGVWALPKGKRPVDELGDLPPDVAVFHVERLDVPDLDAERHLVWLRPA